ncbi:VCBS domain-containing protein, partial [Rhodobacteraceae bacterium HSP-20]
TLTVTSLDGTATQTITVTVNGVNDLATISGNDAGEVTEDDTGAASVSGTLLVSDADTGEAGFQEPAAADLVTDYGTFTFNTTTGAWTFKIDNEAAQSLGDGDSEDVTLTVTSLDGTATQTITVTVNGVNDLATISGNDAGEVTEDDTGTASVSGTLSVSDADTGEAGFQEPAAADLVTDYGTFTFNTETGEWTFAIDNDNAQLLGAGDSEDVTLTVTSLDGTATQTITVTVNGVNDLATISGNDAGSVTEDGTASVSGTLSVADADDGEAGFQEPAAADLDTDYGSFTFDAGTGAWTFTIDNAAAQSLGADDSKDVTLTVTSLDGTDTQTITVTVTGTNDAPVITNSNTTASVTEDAATNKVSGTLSITDADAGQAGFASTSSLNGTYGTFTFDAATKGWTYTLNNSLAATQALTASDVKTETLKVTSTDGTTFDINVTVNGAAEPVTTPTTTAAVSGTTAANGQTDVNDISGTGGPNTTATAGNDNLRDANNTDGTISGGAGNDDIYGRNGNDVLNGDGGNDRLYGSTGNDVLNGGSENDQLFGGSGNDTMNGNDGSDALTGGFGADSVTGGTGADRFIFISLNDSGDTITDFNAADPDKIVLTSIDANGAVAADQAFNWGGTTATANGLWYANNADGTSSTFYADTDGNTSTAELWFIVNGTSFSSGSFDL